jgi:hypothetical protein
MFPRSCPVKKSITRPLARIAAKFVRRRMDFQLVVIVPDRIVPPATNFAARLKGKKFSIGSDRVIRGDFRPGVRKLLVIES